MAVEAFFFKCMKRTWGYLYPGFSFCFSCLFFMSFAGRLLVGFILMGKVFRKAFWILGRVQFKWNSGPLLQTSALILDINPSWWWHVMFGHCTFCIAVNTLWNNSKVLSRVQNVCLIATPNIQLEYVFYTWGNAQSLWVPLFCHQVITPWRCRVLQ